MEGTREVEPRLRTRIQSLDLERQRERPDSAVVIRSPQVHCDLHAQVHCVYTYIIHTGTCTDMHTHAKRNKSKKECRCSKVFSCQL